MNAETALPPLAALRASIDDVDARIVDVFAERFALTRQIGRVKRDEGAAPVDPDRERERLESVRARAVEKGVDPDFIMGVYLALFARVADEHRAVRGEAGPCESGTPTDPDHR